MSLRNYFYRFGKYILTFFFVTLLMVLRYRRRLLLPRKLPQMVLNSVERAA